jgi:hypothetical protein
MKWIYTDCNGGAIHTLFECEADDILAADKVFEMATGLDAKKQPYITVRSPDWAKLPPNSVFRGTAI